jgi:hypothetical protein
MPRTYEAVYHKGRVDWIAPRPHLPEGTRLVVVVEEQGCGLVGREATLSVLDAAWGAWGTRKSAEEIDRELTELRSDWEPSAGA